MPLKKLLVENQILCNSMQKKLRNSVYHGFTQDEICNGGSALGSSQFLLLPQLPQKMTLASKLVKIDSKISCCDLMSDVPKSFFHKMS